MPSTGGEEGIFLSMNIGAEIREISLAQAVLERVQSKVKLMIAYRRSGIPHGIHHLQHALTIEPG